MQLGDGDVSDDDDGDPDATLDATAAPPVEPPILTPTFARDFTELTEVERERYVRGPEIARGGMGRVFEARDLRLGRLVAIKELRPEHRNAARRFEREARITARLQHPAIIHIYEAGVWPGGEPFFAMPKVEGRSLDAVVAEKTSLNERLGLVPNVIAIADALAYAHNRNVIHRDLKPSNVLVGEFGETVVIDWGLAKDLGEPIDPAQSLVRVPSASCDDTGVGGVLGTAAYMPPEQARGASVDQRADVYALGALLYKVLTGKPPYQGPTSAAVIEQVKQQPPITVRDREPGTPPDLAAIVDKAMARVPEDRYESAGALAQDLKRFQTGQLVAAHHYTMDQLVLRWLRRHRVAVGIGGVAVTAVAVVATISIRRIAADEANAKALRTSVLEERGRIELLAGHAGEALANLTGAADDGRVGGNRGFLIADAKRRFASAMHSYGVGEGDVVVAVSPTGTSIAAGGAKLIRFKPDGTSLDSFNDISGRVTVVAFSSHDDTLLAGDEAGVVLERIGGDPVRIPAGAVTDAAFSPDDARVVTASGDTATVWNATNGRKIADSKCARAGNVRSARFDHTGNWVVTTSDEGKPCVWDAKYGDVVANLSGPGAPAAAAWAGDLVITAGSDGAARVWSAEAGKMVVQPLRHDQGTTINVVRLSPDGRQVLTGGTDHVARIWALPRTPVKEGALGAAKLVARLDGHTSAIATAAFSDDGALVATGGYDGLAKVWDRQTGHELATFEHGGPVTSVAFVTGEHRLATGSRDGAARLWEVPAPPEHPPAVSSAVHALAVARDTIAIGADDSVVRLYRGHELVRLDGHKGRVFAVSFAPDGTRLVTGGEDSELLEWPLGARIGAPHALPLGDPAEPIDDLAIAPDGRIAAASPSRVRVFANGARASYEYDHHTINCVAFAPHGEVIAGAEDGSVVSWPGGVHKVLSGPVNAIAVSPTAIVAGGQNAAVIVALDFTPIAALDGTVDDVRAIVFTPDHQRIVTASADGIARVWDAHSGKLLGVRGSRGAAASSLAIAGDTLWVGSEDDAGTVAAWDLGIANDDQDELRRFLAAQRIAVKE